MTHSISIVYDAGTPGSPIVRTIPLNGDYVINTHTVRFNMQRYVPESSESDEVTESASILLQDTGIVPLAYLRLAFRDINLALVQAEERKKNTKAFPVYLVIQPDTQSDIYRSEIISGKVSYAESTLLSDWNSGKHKITIAWTRKNFWEGNTELSATVSNANGSDSGTSGLAVYPVNDRYGTAPTQRDNTLVVGCDYGDLPTPCRVEMKCVSIPGSPTREIVLNSIRVYNNVYSDPANLENEFTGEGGTGGTTKPVSADSNKYSGGYFQELSVTTTEALLISWNISTAHTARMRGNYFAIAGLFALTTNNSQLRIKVSHYSSVIYTGPLITVPSGVTACIIDTVRLPPGIGELNTLNGITISIYGKSLTGGTTTLSLDSLFLLPVDGWLSVNTLDASFTKLYPNDFVTYDGNYNVAYYTAASGNLKSPLGKSGQIMLYPSRYNKFIFNFFSISDSTYGYLSCYVMVKVWYRPRRRTL